MTTCQLRACQQEPIVNFKFTRQARLPFLCDESRVLVGERSERDTIRGVQIRACVVRIYIYVCMYGGTYVIMVVHAMHT